MLVPVGAWASGRPGTALSGACRQLTTSANSESGDCVLQYGISEQEGKHAPLALTLQSRTREGRSASLVVHQ